MSDQITMRHLDGIVARINHITGSPATTYTKTADGKYIPNVGNYHIDSGYGGYQLVRMGNEHGGTSRVTSGYVSKRELYHLMHAYADGYEAAQLAAERLADR